MYPYIFWNVLELRYDRASDTKEPRYLNIDSQKYRVNFEHEDIEISTDGWRLYRVHFAHRIAVTKNLARTYTTEQAAKVSHEDFEAACINAISLVEVSKPPNVIESGSERLKCKRGERRGRATD